jgi:SAM-dependent methyltransferase
MAKENKKRVCLLYKTKSRYNKGMSEEIEILRSNSYAVSLVNLSWDNPKTQVLDSTAKTYRLLNLIRAIGKEQFDFYHSHDLLGIILARAVCLVTRGYYVKDYHELLLAPIKAATENDAHEQPVENNTLFTDYYNQAQMWEKELTDRDRDRLEKTIQLIPNGVETVLDVGCGSGHLANKLSGDYKVVGLDISKEALKRVRVPSVLAPASQIPFPDRSFDLVLCTEILEHLPASEYRDALREIVRVAKSYIIVGVPFRELLQLSRCFCYNCRRKFHMNYHVHSFDVKALNELLEPSFLRQKYVFCGADRIYYNRLLLAIKHHGAGVWSRKETSLCRYCGSAQRRQGNAERNAISYFCDRLNRRLRDRIKNPEKSHIAVLYRRVQQALA